MILSKKEYDAFQKIAISPSKEMFLGRGKFGVVFKYDEKTAMKLFNQNPLCFDIVGKNEIELFNKLNHVQFKNAVLPSELIIYNDECIGYLMDYIPGTNLHDIISRDRVEYYRNLTGYLTKINKIMKDELLKYNIFYSDLKPDNTIVNSDLYLLDFDNSFITKETHTIISEYNVRIIKFFISAVYQNDENYNKLKLAYENALDSALDIKVKLALENPFRLDKYWDDHLITDEIEQLDSFIKKYIKKIDGFKK